MRLSHEGATLSQTNNAAIDSDNITTQNGCCRDNLVYLLISIIVGVILLIVGFIVLIVALFDPEGLGVSEEVALNKGQRGLLGVATVLILIEGTIFATIDYCKFISSLALCLSLHLFFLVPYSFS